MSEKRFDPVGGCPPWCSVEGAAEDGGPHAHASHDLVVGASVEGTAARMIQLAGSDQVRVVVGESVVSVEEAEAFAHALLRLTADAQLAQPGLGFVERLVQQRGMSTGELALAAGVDVERVRAQRSGGAVLTVREFDRVALAAAQLHCLVDADRAVVPAAAVVDEPVAEPEVEEGLDRLDHPEEVETVETVEATVAPAAVEDAFDGGTWADLMELMALAGGSMYHDGDELTDEQDDAPEAVAEPVAEDGDPADDDDAETRPALELVSEPLPTEVRQRAEVHEDWAFAQVELVELIRLGGGPEKPAV